MTAMYVDTTYMYSVIYYNQNYHGGWHYIDS